jgi:hypothetical protein
MVNRICHEKVCAMPMHRFLNYSPISATVVQAVSFPDSLQPRFVGFEVLTKSTIFWNVMPCNLCTKLHGVTSQQTVIFKCFASGVNYKTIWSQIKLVLWPKHVSIHHRLRALYINNIDPCASFNPNLHKADRKTRTWRESKVYAPT